MKTDASSPKRQYYIDWLRILLILTVFLFHIGMIFNDSDWHIKNDQQFPGLGPVMSFLHLWRMPLLFLISGAGSYYALGKRSRLKYLGERFQRLFLPLVAGIFILVPVQVYYERMAQYSSLIDYYAHMFDGIYPEGNFSWHHLWFIAYLFLISLCIIPLMGWFKSTGFHRFQRKLIRWAIKPAGMNLVLLPLLGSQLLLKPWFPEETHALTDDWAFIAFNLIFFLAGFLLFVDQSLVQAIKYQRRYYLLQSILATLMLLGATNNPQMAFWVKEGLSVLVAWSFTVTAFAYGACYLNGNHPVRKTANQAIYPFYLLHQPVIIIWAYYIIQWEIPAFTKAVLIILLSFVSTMAIYWFLIRPYNLARVLFGLRRKKQTSPNPQNAKWQLKLKPETNTFQPLYTMEPLPVGPKRACVDQPAHKAFHRNDQHRSMIKTTSTIQRP